MRRVLQMNHPGGYRHNQAFRATWCHWTNFTNGQPKKYSMGLRKKHQCRSTNCRCSSVLPMLPQEVVQTRDTSGLIGSRRTLSSIATFAQKIHFRHLVLVLPSGTWPALTLTLAKQGETLSRDQSSRQQQMKTAGGESDVCDSES